jgi:sugar phosphate isomerase/epimerase
MKNEKISFTVFTKPWKHQSIGEIGKLVSGLGFDGIEFPLREGYQVEPQNAEKGLVQLVEKLGEYGVNVYSVASDMSEKVFAGCAAAGIPVIRIIVHTELKDGFYASMEKVKREINGVLPLCEKYGIKVGIQHHFGPGLNNSMELKQLIEKYDPKHIGAIWDAAHSALAGEEPEQGLDIVWSHLCMVNMKNGFYRFVSGPDAETAKWEYYFSSAKKGLASWVRISDYLKSRKYRGVICLTAEFSEEERVNQLIAEDIAYAKSLFI